MSTFTGLVPLVIPNFLHHIGDTKTIEKLITIDQCDELERQLKATLDVVEYRKQQIVKLGNHLYISNQHIKCALIKLVSGF